MSECNHNPPATFCGCESLPTGYEVTIGPVEDNGTTGYLKLIDGKWWLCCNQETTTRELTAEELRQVFG